MNAHGATDPEDEGKGLLLVDLLSLGSKFSFRRYREDFGGFLIAWGVVAFLLLVAYLITRAGAP